MPMTEPSPAVTHAAPAAGRPALPPLVVRGRRLLPIVQGGMGVGVSAHRLAGTVASLDAVGTIASVDLRRHHPDLMRASAHSDKATIDAANLVALDREIRAAKELANGRGMVAVNVMRAVSEYAHYVQQACESGADAVVVGAGLPLDLPELASALPGRRADPDPVRRARHQARREEVDAQGPAARRDRDRASALRRGPSRRGEDRGPDRPAVRLRARAARDARVLPRRRHRRRSGAVDTGGRDQLARAGARADGGRRRRGPGRHGVRGDRGRRRRHRVQARPRGRQARGHRRIHERRGPARARRAHAVAHELPQVPAEARGGRAQEAALHAQVRLPDPVRPARRHREDRPVLHRHAARRRAARRRREGALLPWRLAPCPSAARSGRCATSSPISSPARGRRRSRRLPR